MEASVVPLLCYLGHAGFALRTGNSCLLMDPWLSGNGAFLHTWFPHPDNSSLADQIIAFLGKRNVYVYISHVHEDHLDIDFNRRLEMLRPTYLLPQFNNDSLRRAVGSLAGEKYFLKDSEQFQI